MRSMLALQPVWEVTTAHGEEPRRRETTTDSTFAPSTSFTQDRRPSISLESPLSSASSPSPRSSPSLVTSMNFFSSKSARLDTATSSMGSVRNSTSKPFLSRPSAKAEELGQSFAVGGVLDHPELEVPPEGLPEGVPRRLVLPARELLQRVERPLHELLPDDARDPGLLEDLAAHVQREIGRVYDALHEAEVPGHQTVVKLVRDEHALDIELDVPGLHHLAALVEAGRARDEDHPRELDGTLHVEVVVRHGIEELLEGALEERVVLLLLALLGAAEPQRLRVVLRRPVEDRVVLGLHHGVHRLGLLALSEGLVGLLLGLLGRLYILHLPVHTLRRPQLDGELDEVAVLADELLQLEVRADVVRLLPHVQRDLRAPHEVLAAGVWLHGVSGAPGLALPDPLLALLVALCLNPHPVGHEEGRVKADAELTDEVRVVVLLRLLQGGRELGSARVRDRAQRVQQLLARHAPPRS